MKKLNILQIYDYMNLGGAESHIITLTKALMDNGHNVYVASSDGPAVNILKRLSIPFYEIQPPEKEAYIENAGKISEIIHNNKIDIIHVHPFQSQTIVALAKMIIDVPVVTTIHGAYLTPAVSEFEEIIDQYIFVSPETCNFHIENGLIKGDNYQIIPNCVEIPTDIYTIKLNEPLRISYISRLDNDKLPSILFFINSVKQLSKMVDVEVTVIGSGDAYTTILNTVKEVNNNLSKSKISIINGADNVSDHIIKSDVIVGVGRVILEALSLGRIPICIGNNSYVGIVNEQNLKRISKVNFTDRNTTTPLESEFLIEDILNIIRDPDKINNEVLQAFQYIKAKYDVRLSAKEHQRLYTKLINRNENKTINLFQFAKFRNQLLDIDNFLFSLELQEKGFKYHLDTIKEKKILIIPDFFSGKDSWINILTFLAKKEQINTTTVVIRIGNEFLEDLEAVIGEIENVYTSIEKLYKLDLLVDYQYLDEVNENLLLLEMNYFIPTNNTQQKVIYKCELLGCNVNRITF